MISGMKDGEVFYINRMDDFENLMDQSVYDALKQFCGDVGGEKPADIITRRESRIEDLKYQIQELEDDVRELENNNDDLTDQVDDLKGQTKKLKGKIAEIKAVADMAEKAANLMNQISEELEDIDE